MRNDLDQAKRIDIVYFLSKQGIQPKKESSARAYYLSPFREETAPSFIVDKHENRFYDWGEKWGGDVIDIAERMWSCKTSEAINKLLTGEDIPQYHKRPAVIDRSPKITVLGERDKVTNEALIEYMEGIRKLSIDVINVYCQEIDFQFATHKYVTYKGVGMKNDLGGYSIRSTWFKGSSTPSGISTVLTKDVDRCCLFEGFLDFISAVMIYGEPNCTSIILNSTVYVSMIMDILQGFGEVQTWVDNDNAGNVAVDELIANHVNVVDMRSEFANYNDLNEKLQAES